MSTFRSIFLPSIILGWALFILVESSRVKRQFASPGSTLIPTIGSIHDAKHTNSFANKISSNLPNNFYDPIFEKFQINKNSIIRTHDSRALGAKYLNETELPSNEDCLRWCWNTSSCNLAVYEEKTRGSCYLFDCGSLDDFKCRFTPHNFYSSSVLQINRNSYFLNEWKSQANQESELAGLRDKQQDKPTLDSSVLKNTIIENTQVSKMSKTQSPSIVNKVSKCRHYQFECRNSSECIAIYNVCDGIPQCSDSSDEAKELECHKSRINSVKSPTDVEIEKTKQPEIYRASNKQSKTIFNSPQVASSYNSNINSLYPNGKLPQDVPGDQTKMVNYPSVYLNYNYPRTANDKIPDENVLYNNHVSGQLTNGEFNGIQSWNQFSLPNEGINKIDKFSAYINEPEQYNSALKEPAYWPSFNYQQNPDLQTGSHTIPRQTMDVAYNLPVSLVESRSRPVDYIPQQQTLPQSQYQQISQPPIFNQYLPNSLQSHTEPKPAPVTQVFIANSTFAKEPAKVSKLPPLSNLPLKQLNNSKSRVEYSHISSNQKSVQLPSASVVAISYMHDTGPQNGRETNSAVIALTLGLFVTTILIVIVGCRMKSFKKRIARRGRSLAHDADYLVNGMYL